MGDSLLSQLRSKGEEYFTDLSNRLLSNPVFVEGLKNLLAAKELVDKQAADALKRMNLATRREVSKLEQRVTALEAEVESLRAKRSAPARRSRKES
jgi:polyhydroxyalkanoate synthesis regulator phasin